MRDLFDLAEIRASGAGKVKAQVEDSGEPAVQRGGFRLIYPPEGQIGEAVSREDGKSEL